MTLLPPTLRANRRYLLARIEPAGTNPEQKSLYLAVSEAVSTLFGDAGAAEIQPAVVYAGEDMVIVRCIRGRESALSLALATVTACAGVPVTLRTLATSGTIKKLKGIPGSAPQSGRENEKTVSLNGKEFTVIFRRGGKADLREKGFNKRELLFFTEEDLVNLNGDPVGAPEGNLTED